ncbi:hypothetical protein AYO44_06635 [Planctomycetaceae bacterium SCGC AG-212-F19]|nr:hypothetical protein AYO44_06635 [Planctomycetaceae bacterium SCGC AG-212-F19]
MVTREVPYDDETVALISTRFVSVSVDRQFDVTPAEEKFLRHCSDSSSACHILSAGGQKLAGAVNGDIFEPSQLKKLLKEGLEKFKAEEPDEVLKTLGPRSEWGPKYKPPEGGLVLYKTTRLLEPALGVDTSVFDKFDKAIRQAARVDRCWVRKDEAEALARGMLPESLKRRLFLETKLVPETKLDLKIDQGRLSGSLSWQNTEKEGGAGYQADLLGFVETKDGKVTRFDLLAKGLYLADGSSSCGTRACLSSLPKGKKFSVAIAVSLADPRDGVARVRPHDARGGGGYLGD